MRIFKPKNTTKNYDLKMLIILSDFNESDCVNVIKMQGLEIAK